MFCNMEWCETVKYGDNDNHYHIFRNNYLQSYNRNTNRVFTYIKLYQYERVVVIFR